MQPNAIIHGDCKINNVLFDQQGERVLAVIDLDNNMSGHWAWDFGDLVRSVTLAVAGLMRKTTGPVCSVSCWSWFRRSRGEHLVAAPAYLAFMLGLRFLTDHLSGDVYFSVPEHGDNLQRAREQFALFHGFEANRSLMERVVRECT